MLHAYPAGMSSIAGDFLSPRNGVTQRSQRHLQGPLADI
jgi:hypothetical protein